MAGVYLKCNTHVETPVLVLFQLFDHVSSRAGNSSRNSQANKKELELYTLKIKTI